MNETRGRWSRGRMFVAAWMGGLVPALAAQVDWMRPRDHRAEGSTAMAYDSARERVVRFGGLDRDGGSTWEWDGAAWALRDVPVRPTSWPGDAIAYDSARRRVVLFGGGPYYNATWEWDGVTWVQRQPATAPIGRSFFALAYDSARQRVVLFGGQNAWGTLADTWEWDGSNWLQQSPVTSPGVRYRHAMAYDSARRRVVLFGGSNGSDLGDTWEWDGTNWAQPTLAAHPSGRVHHAMAYDGRRVLLFGGMAACCSPVPDSTWLYGTPGATQTLGSACAGTNGPPVLASGLPFLGNPAFALDLVSARASAPCVFLLANGTQTLQLGGGCTLYVDGALLPFFAASNASGFASVGFALPLDEALRGASVYAQGVVVDPLGPFAGLAFSAGMRLVLGD